LDLASILIALSSIVIALVSLTYAVKQRNVIKKEIAKKSYLESAQTNLNIAIQSLRNQKLPNLSDPNCDLKDLDDTYFDALTIVEDLLRANFESKKTQFTLKVSYELVDVGESGKHYSEKEERTTNDFSQSSPKLLIDLLKSRRTFYINSETDILDVQRQVGNSPSLNDTVWGLRDLWFVINRLSAYEEVYETVCPNVLKQANQLLEETVEQVFKAISAPKTIEINLKKFSKTDDITKYVIDTLTDYTHITAKLSHGISELDSKLTEARKELFLRISP
jgi:hypothetical protein